MSKSSRKTHRFKDSGEALPRALRLIERGDLKQAVKDLRQLYRDQPSDELRDQLERALFLRARQLRSYGQIDEARGAADSLFALPGPSKLPERDLAELLLGLGMADKVMQIVPQVSLERELEFKKSAADQAVLHPNHARSPWPELGSQALLIGEALALIANAQDEPALKKLAGIPRSSPLADWKLFARGLIAYYRDDALDARANWDRLEAGRAASRIAATLSMAKWGPRSGSAPTIEIREFFDRAERVVFGAPLSSRMRQLQQGLVDLEISKARDAARAIRETLKERDVELSRRTTAATLNQLSSRAESRDQFAACEQVVRQLEPFPFDPKWLRWRAIYSQYVDEGHDRWREFLAEFARLEGFSEEDKAAVRMLVHGHIASEFAEKGLEDGDFLPRDPDGPLNLNLPRNQKKTAIKWLDSATASGETQVAPTRLNRHLRVAIEEFRLAISAGPKMPKPYIALAELYRTLGREADAAAIYDELLVHQPDHSDALLFTATRLAATAGADRAAERCERWQRLHPLDVRGWQLAAQIAALRAWECAAARDWAKARDALDQAPTASQGGEHPFVLAARRYVLEQCAGTIDAQKPPRQNPLYKSAVELAGGEAAVALVVAIESRAMGASFDVQKAAYDAWLQSLKKKRDGAAAAHMVDALKKYQKWRPRVAFDELESKLVSWLLGCTRTTFSHSDLRKVCEFLVARNTRQPGVQALLNKGIRSFPTSPFFPLVDATYRYTQEAGPPNLHTLDQIAASFGRAKKLAEESSDPADKQLLDGIAKLQDALNLVRRRVVWPFGMPMGFYDEDEDLDDDDDDDDYDYYDDDDKSGPTVPAGMSIDEIRRMVESAAAKYGLDPAEILGAFGRGARPPESARQRPGRNGIQ